GSFLLGVSVFQLDLRFTISRLPAPLVPPISGIPGPACTACIQTEYSCRVPPTLNLWRGSMKVRLVQVLALAAVICAFAVPASAQVYTGRIDMTVTDSTGAVLPGVTVELSGADSRSAVTDANGEVRFLNLPPGDYVVTARLQGFNDYTNRNVAVLAGGSVPLRVTMGVAGMAEGVEVTAETPVIDPKKMTTSTNVTNEQLQEIPSSRDPW